MEAATQFSTRSGVKKMASTERMDTSQIAIALKDTSQISSTPLPEDIPDLRMTIFHNEMEAATKMSNGSAPVDLKDRPQIANSPHPEDLEDLRMTINNNKMASKEARLAPRYSSTISGAFSDWSECREGAFCRQINTEKCHCFDEKRPASVIHDGHWQPQESEDSESEAERPNKTDGSNRLKIASVYHKCTECGAHHKVPQYSPKREATLEAVQEKEADEAEMTNSIANTEISLGSTLEEVLLQDTMQIDPQEEEAEAEAMADPLEIVEFIQAANIPQQETPEIIILEEVINVVDSEEEDHIPDTDDEEEALAYGRLIRDTLYWPGGIHHLHVVYPVPYVPIRREI